MRGERRPPEEPDRRPPDDLMAVPSLLISGMGLYGGGGWLLGRWLDVPALFPVGLVLGLAFALYLVYVRFGR